LKRKLLYRRGKTNNGDLDVVISNQNGRVHGLLNKLINSLIIGGYLKHKLWNSTEVREKKQKHNAIRLPGSRQVFDDFEKVTFFKFKYVIFKLKICVVFLCISSTIYEDSSPS
jgi:hypothetical protein